MLKITRVLVQDGQNIRKVNMVEGKPVVLDAGVYTITEDRMGIIITPDRDKFKIPARLYEPVYGLARRFMREIDKGYLASRKVPSFRTVM